MVNAEEAIPPNAPKHCGKDVDLQDNLIVTMQETRKLDDRSQVT